MSPVYLADNLLRTLVGTFAAARTLLLIDMRNVIFNRDCASLTDLLAHPAADTTGLAHLHDNLAHIL